MTTTTTTTTKTVKALSMTKAAIKARARRAAKKAATLPVVVPAPVAPVAVAPVARAPRTAAHKMASDLVRFLRLDVKHPYGTRGKKAILDMAFRVALLAKADGASFKDVLHPTAVPFVDDALARVADAVGGSADDLLSA